MAPVRGLCKPQYEAVAAVVNSLPDDVRQRVADHFASEFNFRYAGFDPHQWHLATGGRISAGLPPSEVARLARVAAYNQQIT